MSSIDNLQPASKADTLMYNPYYARELHEILPKALSLYQQGYVEGERMIEGETNIPFVATWYVSPSRLPAEKTRCRIQFEGSADLSYEISLDNFEFVEYLIMLIKDSKRNRQIDFSQKFYRKLLRVDE